MKVLVCEGCDSVFCTAAMAMGVDQHHDAVS